MMWKLIIVTILAVGVLCDDIATAVNEQTTQQIRDTLKAQCKKNGAEDKAQDVENAAKNFVECVKGLFDFSTIKKEIEDAKPNGALDEVFGKYCAKSPQLKTCIHTLTTSATPCLEASVREQVGPINNGADQLIDFICYKDGDRIACVKMKMGMVTTISATTRSVPPYHVIVGGWGPIASHPSQSSGTTTHEAYC